MYTQRHKHREVITFVRLLQFVFVFPINCAKQDMAVTEQTLLPARNTGKFTGCQCTVLELLQPHRQDLCWIRSFYTLGLLMNFRLLLLMAVIDRGTSAGQSAFQTPRLTLHSAGETGQSQHRIHPDLEQICSTAACCYSFLNKDCSATKQHRLLGSHRG